MKIRKKEREAPSIPITKTTPQFVIASPPEAIHRNMAPTSDNASVSKAQEHVSAEEGNKTPTSLTKLYERRWRVSCIYGLPHTCRMTQSQPRIKNRAIYASQPDDVKEIFRKLSEAEPPVEPSNVQLPPAKRRRVGPGEHI